MALKKETSTVPVVFVAVTDPDGQGFVATLARPGGNMTGLAFRGDAMAAKLIELVRETLPTARRDRLRRPATAARFVRAGTRRTGTQRATAAGRPAQGVHDRWRAAQL
ncbi:MAG: hypothetical protein HY017_15540 [Betaproteobacteria bacterium]|nr:hypothetical protein [Betaproteobacteria bacterium]